VCARIPSQEVKDRHHMGEEASMFELIKTLPPDGVSV